MTKSEDSVFYAHPRGTGAFRLMLVVVKLTLMLLFFLTLRFAGLAAAVSFIVASFAAAGLLLYALRVFRTSIVLENGELVERTWGPLSKPQRMSVENIEAFEVTHEVALIVYTRDGGQWRLGPWGPPRWSGLSEVRASLIAFCSRCLGAAVPMESHSPTVWIRRDFGTIT